jgi:hypothetical protein
MVGDLPNKVIAALSPTIIILLVFLQHTLLIKEEYYKCVNAPPFNLLAWLFAILAYICMLMMAITPPKNSHGWIIIYYDFVGISGAASFSFCFPC